jgi:hypothetical protein
MGVSEEGIRPELLSSAIAVFERLPPAGNRRVQAGFLPVRPGYTAKTVRTDADPCPAAAAWSALGPSLKVLGGVIVLSPGGLYCIRGKVLV